MSAPQQASAFNNQIPPRYTIKNITAAYTVTGADYGVILSCTGATSYTLGTASASSVGAGFNVWIWNQTATTAMAVTIDPNGTETIDGASTLILRQGEGTQIVSDGSNWQTNTKKTMRGYAEAYPATLGRPVATGQSAVALGLSYASGQDSFAAAISSNSASYGAQAQGAVALGNFALASGTYSIAIGQFASATTYYSVAIGANSSGQGSKIATSDAAMALGGSYASGTDSFAAAVTNNTSTYGATAANAIAIGNLAKAGSSYSLAIGGYNPAATSTGAIAIGGGQGNQSQGSYSFTLGGYQANNRATTINSYAVGEGSLSSIQGKWVYASGQFAAIGDAQTANLVLRNASTSATPVVLVSSYTGSLTASTDNQIILANNSAYTFSILVVARQSAAGGTASASWQITGLIRREANAASTTLVASTVTTISNVPAWTIAVTADTTNGGLAITATGAASTNIRWVATAQTSEVTYA